ncbi:hypothetical protein [Isoptericola sp. NPDC019482]|uniref:hypothetical protein n=1 Tax=Isoptericola sp. NPDC019482 TaxID=3154688 RepID=UPI0034835C02
MDLRTAHRVLAAVLMPLGPAAVAVARYVMPYDTTDTPDEVVAGILGSPAAEELMAWLSLVALLTLVPGAFAVLRLVRPGAPALAAAAGLLLVPGYLALFGSGVGDATVVAGAEAGVAPSTLATILEIAYQDPVASLAGTVFVVGHLAGTVVLGLALWRSRVVSPAWAVVMGVSQPLHLVAALTANHPLDLLAWGMTAVAMGAAAVAVLRTRDDDWDVPARPVRSRRGSAAQAAPVVS